MKIEDLDDQVLLIAETRGNFKEMAKKCTQGLGAGLPTNTDAYLRLKFRTSGEDTDEWASLPSQSQEVNDF